MNDRNYLAKAFYASVWVTVLFIVGYEAYKNVTESTDRINVKFKTMEELINGNP